MGVRTNEHHEGIMELMGTKMLFRRNAEIYGEKEPADYIYKIFSGAVRAYRVLADGRRQIGAFYMAGDIFGLENPSKYTCSVEAISDTSVLLVRRRSLEAAISLDGYFAHQLLTDTARELHRVQDHLLVLIKTAEQRVAGFLLEMYARGPNATPIELPMSRQDIADYLGLTIETVSRTMTHLETTAMIKMPSARRVVLCNINGLHRLNS
jgi:CRP/FNR family nitrogen fixation transcriptional regulator